MTTSVLPATGVRFTGYPAAPELVAEIEGYWTVEVEQAPAVVELVPDALVDVTFELHRDGRAWVTGPRTTPVAYTHVIEARLLGVSLRPVAAARVLQCSASSLDGEWQPLAELIGDAAAALSAHVMAATDVRGRLAVLDAFLAARLRATGGDARVSAAIDSIVASDGDVEVATLGAVAGASPRNLGRLFDEWVGMSPKRFARVVRAQAALRRLVEDPAIDLTELALELGFADHGHLSRELRALTAVTPSALAARLSDSSKR